MTARSRPDPQRCPAALVFVSFGAPRSTAQAPVFRRGFRRGGVEAALDEARRVGCRPGRAVRPVLTGPVVFADS